MPETLRAYVERMARFTTIEDEFTAETPEAEALRDRYEDADEYRADLDDDRLCGELNTLEEMIRDAREVLAQPDPISALEAAKYWLAEEAASPHPGQTRPDDILRVIRDALAGKAMAPLTGPFHGPGLADQCRLVASLIGTDSQQGRNEARQTALRIADVSALMLAALRAIRDDIRTCGLEGFYSEAKGAGLSGALVEVDAAIAAAEGQEG